MNYKMLGSSNIVVSEVGLSCWAIGGETFIDGINIGWSNNDDNESYKALHRAYELGINYFDSAYLYGLGHADKVLGTFIRDIERNNIVISTKIDFNRRELLIEEILDKTLTNLDTEYIDILYLSNITHNNKSGYELDVLIDNLKRSGKIRAVGLCIDSIEDLKFNNLLPDVIQIHYNPFSNTLDNELIKLAKSNNIGVAFYTKEAHIFDQKKGKNANIKKMKADQLRDAFKLVRRLKKEFGMNLEDLHKLALNIALSQYDCSCILAGFKSVNQVEVNARVSNETNDPRILDLLKQFSIL